MRTLEPEVVASAAPVDDHDRWRMCGAMLLGRAVSLNRTGFWGLKVCEKKSFFSGRLRAGAGMIGVDGWVLRAQRALLLKKGFCTVSLRLQSSSRQVKCCGPSGKQPSRVFSSIVAC